jgi:phosphoribosylaminoimidazolecarboxamide formyltransferase/IMP cyclohydrolase
MLRAATKNYRYVTVIVDPADYGIILGEMKEHGGLVTESTNFRLAQKTFQLTSWYDEAISMYLEKQF